MSLPGDELLPDPSFRFTRAITIRAPASAVWPWILQIGQDRAGFYSNTWLENLTGADIHNANAIRQEWQQRRIGDRVLLARPDLLGGLLAAGAQTRIVALEPERMIANIPGRFVLQPINDNTTRVLLRESIPSTFLGRTVNSLLWDPTHFVMQQRMLRGLKERAEGRPLVPSAVMIVARGGWILGSAGLLAWFLARRGWRPWVLIPIAFVVLVLWSTGDWDSALAGFLAVGITILGALAFGRRWWPPYLLIATAVALVLLLAPDGYTAIGLTFAAVCLAALSGVLFRSRVASLVVADLQDS